LGLILFPGIKSCRKWRVKFRRRWSACL